MISKSPFSGESSIRQKEKSYRDQDSDGRHLNLGLKGWLHVISHVQLESNSNTSTRRIACKDNILWKHWCCYIAVWVVGRRRSTIGAECDGWMIGLGEVEICSIDVVDCSWEGILWCETVVNQECSCTRTDLCM